MTANEITAVIHEHMKKRTRIVDQMSAAKDSGDIKLARKLNHKREQVNCVIEAATSLRTALEYTKDI